MFDLSPICPILALTPLVNLLRSRLHPAELEAQLPLAADWRGWSSRAERVSSVVFVFSSLLPAHKPCGRSSASSERPVPAAYITLTTDLADGLSFLDCTYTYRTFASSAPSGVLPEMAKVFGMTADVSVLVLSVSPPHDSLPSPAVAIRVSLGTSRRPTALRRRLRRWPSSVRSALGTVRPETATGRGVHALHALSGWQRARAQRLRCLVIPALRRE